MGSVRVAIVGVGNCAASLVQGVEYYKDADPHGTVPGPDARQVRRLPRPRRRVRRRVRRRRQEGRQRPLRGDRRLARTTPSRSPTCPPTGVTVQRGHTLDGLGKYYRETIDESDAEPVDVVAGCSRTPRPTCSSPTCRWAPRRPTSSTPSARSTPASPSSTRCRCSSPPTPSGPRSSRTPACRSSATTSRPRSARPSRTACWPSCSRTAACALDRTYQLNVGGNMDFKNMLERERLESKKISKTQAVTSNLTGALAGKTRRPQRAHRPVRLRRVARRPQVGLRPPRGSRLRRRAAEPRVQARGLGLPELGRHHHRRDPRGEDRQGPRHRRPDPLGVVVPHEVPAGAAPRRRRPRQASRPSSAGEEER